jgi:hypothetical protein
MAFKTVFDRRFKYRRADATDVRLTFARIRREQRNAQRRAAAEVASKVIGRITPAAGCAVAQGAIEEWPFPARIAASVREDGPLD